MHFVVHWHEFLLLSVVVREQEKEREREKEKERKRAKRRVDNKRNCSANQKKFVDFLFKMLKVKFVHFF